MVLFERVTISDNKNIKIMVPYHTIFLIMVDLRNVVNSFLSQIWGPFWHRYDFTKIKTKSLIYEINDF